MSGWWVPVVEIAAAAYAMTDPPWLVRTWERVSEPFRRVEDWVRRPKG